jgi:hypothetical protein
MIKQKNKDKLVLLGTENKENRYEYIIEKNEGFREIFISIMEKFGFERIIINKTFFNYTFNRDNIEKQIEFKTSDFIDSCYNYKNKDFDIDVFYGTKKIILIIRTKKGDKLREIINSKIKWEKKDYFKKQIKKLDKLKKKRIKC